MGVNENAPAQYSNSNLTLETFKEIFEKCNKDVVIESIEEAQGSGRGDNYTATLYRVHLHGYCKRNKSKWEKSVICKRLPDNIARREAYNSVQLFCNEVRFYTSIMPELVNFQRMKTAEVFKAMPQHYLAENDLLIMEDLRTKGFKMADRKAGLTLSECKFALKQIAVLHSLSLSYKFERPKQFEKLKAVVKEQIFCKDNENWYKDYYTQLTKNALAMVSDVLPKSSKYIEKLREFVESSTFFNHMIELVSKESFLSVICHGDCWTNNFLYRYDDKGEVLEMSFVDFQLIRYGSAALDVADIVFCCINKEMRDEHLESLLQIYVNEFYKTLKSLTTLPDIINTESKCLEV
ncbi:uncharacterized protein LOC129616143 isoform X2 [Condylostylus longicornis]|nr:uncharacterized protein LOC129616143 isoform X2 [Condylostylus longicornis]XP_055387602.1 uncharacterized protein LOC129616143 isoform X2 [Condylostylus longicornis]